MSITFVKWMILDDRAAPTKPWGAVGSCRNRVSRGMRPSAPNLIVCTTLRSFQSQKVRVSPYAEATSAGLKPYIAHPHLHPPCVNTIFTVGVIAQAQISVIQCLFLDTDCQTKARYPRT